MFASSRTAAIGPVAVRAVSPGLGPPAFAFALASRATPMVPRNSPSSTTRLNRSSIGTVPRRRSGGDFERRDVPSVGGQPGRDLRCMRVTSSSRRTTETCSPSKSWREYPVVSVTASSTATKRPSASVSIDPPSMVSRASGIARARRRRHRRPVPPERRVGVCPELMSHQNVSTQLKLSSATGDDHPVGRPRSRSVGRRAAETGDTAPQDTLSRRPQSSASAYR